MRLWSLHPRYLDQKGLVALWREALLAQAVIAGKARGYRAHPPWLSALGPVTTPEPHPLFDAADGEIADWQVVTAK